MPCPCEVCLVYPGRTNNIVRKIKAEAQKQGKEQEEKTELWLMSPTGQFVLAFLRYLVHVRPEELYALPVAQKTKDEQMIEFTKTFFDPDSPLLRGGMNTANEVFMQMKLNKEFILPTSYPPIKQIPRYEFLCNQSNGYRFQQIWNQHFVDNDPNNDGRPRADFAITSKDHPLYGLQTSEQQRVFVEDIEAANGERFPICALFDIAEAIKEGKRDSLSTPELRLAVKAAGYVFSTIDTLLSYAKYGWDEHETQCVCSAGSPFGGIRRISSLRWYETGRYLVAHRCVSHVWLENENGDDRLLVVRRPAKNFAAGNLGT